MLSVSEYVLVVVRGDQLEPMTEQLASLFDSDPRARARLMGIKRAS